MSLSLSLLNLSSVFPLPLSLPPSLPFISPLCLFSSLSPIFVSLSLLYMKSNYHSSFVVIIITKIRFIRNTVDHKHIKVVVIV